METIKLPEPVIVEPVHANTPALTADAKNVLPSTTAAQDLITLGQRRINMIWEGTQSLIAILVTVAVIGCVWIGKTSELLAGAFGMIVGMYFQRTNHTKIGGIGGTDSR